MQFQEIIVLALHNKIFVCSMSCTCMQRIPKNCGKIKNSEYSDNFYRKILAARHVPRILNAITSEIMREKLSVWPQLNLERNSELKKYSCIDLKKYWD